MSILKQLSRFLLTLVLLGCSLMSSAEQSLDFGNLQVHYIALPTTFLPANTAKEYAIKRSRYTAYINISVLDKNAELKAVTAEISGIGKNLIGQNEVLKFKEIREQNAVYYIAEYPFNNEELVHFNIDIKAQNKKHNLRFKHKFYVE
ncbi:DUF4426 domain-containing protein [Psychromonas aquimarina]|uniref:DUF4426 domain-containing protein n=1 Tax=Psychromonas aquimarina TaxID=444919 RepID=UPI00042A7E18|nr:DUF4426 domain-containing protein [Psychromonas aquimarina]